MPLSRRSFLKTMAATMPVAGGGCAALCGGQAPFVVEGDDFQSFAQAVAYARGRVGESVRVLWRLRGQSPLAAWHEDDTIRLVGTGQTEAGKWHRTARGLCLEFMLRMEVMGPIASTPHPRPDCSWEPEWRVGDARRLMLRMLQESGVEIETRSAAPVRGKTRSSAKRSFCLVRAETFLEGQRLGLAEALAAQQKKPVEEILRSEAFQNRLERDLSLPG